MAGKDYGPKGCCGPAALAMIAGTLGTLVFGVVKAAGILFS
jgi:hypothetical protein